MLTMDELMAMLSGVGADCQFIEQDYPILSTSDAKKYFDITRQPRHLFWKMKMALWRVLFPRGTDGWIGRI